MHSAAMVSMYAHHTSLLMRSLVIFPAVNMFKMLDTGYKVEMSLNSRMYI